MFARGIVPEIEEALLDTPVLLLNGARQTGKSTLALQLSSGGQPMRYMTLDDASVLSAAREDPDGFVAGLEGAVVLDEVQRAPELFLAIKASVDRSRTPGRFLLTGSADILLLPSIADSLAGRMEIFTLWPLSQAEMTGAKFNFIDHAFAKHWRSPSPPGRGPTDLVEMIARGGYPVIQQRESEARRRGWFGGYLTTILQRDIRELSNIADISVLPRLLGLIASRTCSLLNFADLARNAGIPPSTLKRYMTLLETTFLVQLLNPWSVNVGKRLSKTPKLYMNDTGLIAYLLGMNRARLASDRMSFGPLLENFVLMELRKQSGWSKVRPHFLYLRIHAGEEVDIVLEDPAGDVVGIEVKAAASVNAADFKGLRTLAELAGKRFRRGIVLYTGTQAVPFGKELHALPISTLW